MQKITPFLWFDNNAEEAMNFYVSLFDHSKIESIYRYPEGVQDEHMQGMEGKVLTGVFELEGYQFMALDGGPYFQFNPSISFFVQCKTEDEIDRLHDQLSQGGVMMPLQQYDFADKYSWVQDRFGVTWQLFMGSPQVPQKITPAFLFVGEQAGRAEEAMNFYTTLFKDSGIEMIDRYPAGGQDPEGTVRHGRFKLDGQLFMAMDSAWDHQFAFNEAVSLYVDCESQEELDRLWDELSAHPDSEQCGWLKDRFGVSWQIVPSEYMQLMNDPNQEKVNRVIESMLQMKKIDMDELRRVYEGDREQSAANRK
jgi:predicted 3-demethylubiquinone-9 3-methyltransferase (glyoxalase superfamily)